MRHRKFSSDSDSSEDLPLISVKSEKDYNVITKTILEKYTDVHCEICCKHFDNQYSYIVHSASHIIIPLIDVGFKFCSVCTKCFTNQKDLEDHILENHKEQIISTLNNVNHRDLDIDPNTAAKKEIVPSTLVIKSEDGADTTEIIEFNSENFDEDTKDNIRSRIVFEDYDDILSPPNLLVQDFDADETNLIMSNGPCISDAFSYNESDVKVEIDNQKQYGVVLKNSVNVNQSNDVYMSNGLNNISCNHDVKYDLLNNVNDFKFHNVVNKKQNGDIKIENDDITENSCVMPLQNLNITTGQNLLEVPYKISFHNDCLQKGVVASQNSGYRLLNGASGSHNGVIESQNGIIGLQNGGIEIKNSDDAFDFQNENIVKYVSIHYDNLLKPGIFKCKRCNKMYPNRLKLIEHEPTHMYLVKSNPDPCYYCENYIAHKNIEAHCMKNHMVFPEPTFGVNNLRVCQVCGLKCYSLMKHSRRHHTFSLKRFKMDVNKMCKKCFNSYNKSVNNRRQYVRSVYSFVCVSCGVRKSGKEKKSYSREERLKLLKKKLIMLGLNRKKGR